MEKIIVPVSKCIPGMMTANPVIDLKTGTTILQTYQILTPENIKNIQNFIHTDIWVFLDSFDKVWHLPSETIDAYKKYTETLMSIITNMDTQNIKDITEFDQYCQEIPMAFQNNYSLIGCTHLIEQLDYNTYNHSLNVAFISMLICRWCNFDDHFTSAAIKAGLLHDIGMINLSFDPYTSKDTWTEEQRTEYEKHPIYSYNIVSKIKDLDSSIPKAILAHHERCDGSGFPVHISAPYINLLGKVLGLADAYELLRHETHIFNVLRTLLLDKLTQYEPKLLLTFCSYLATYYIGTYVILNTGDIGEVVYINPQCVYRPIIKMNDQFINLFEDSSLEIVAVK